MPGRSPLVEFLAAPVSDGPVLRGTPRWLLIALVVFALGIWGESANQKALRADEERDRAETAQVAQAQAEADKIAANKATAERAEEKRKGLHCLSAWDGSNRSLVDQVKASLNDPGSFEHSNTWIQPVDKDGRHYIKMVFRARNPFNALMPAEAIGSVDNASCEATLKSITPLG